MQIIRTGIQMGLKEPVRILHTTDTHLTLCDGRDDERKQKLAVKRKTAFHDENGSVEQYLEETLAYGRQNCDLIIHTGDLIDFVSEANIDRAAQVLHAPDVFFIAGNHEFSAYVGEAWEDHAYRMNAYMKIQPRLGVNLFFASRQVKGVNIVGVDNGYYRFEDWYLPRLQMEVEKGLPILLLMHNPLYEASLYRYCMEDRHTQSAALVGCGEAELMRYPEYRAIQQRPDDATRRFMDYLASEPAIRAVIAGHLHFSFESMLPCGKMQYVTGGGYHGIARELILT